MVETLLVAAGGALGSVARCWVGVYALPLSRDLPLGTTLINIVGSLASFFGTFILAAGRYPVSESGRLFFMAGICGGFTACSSFSLQTLDLLRRRASGRAFIDVAASVLFCLGAVALGHTVASQLNGGARQVIQNAIEEDRS